jgi:radical SAM superfamily enzyme YgiQ (UPF0313 family)
MNNNVYNHPTLDSIIAEKEDKMGKQTSFVLINTTQTTLGPSGLVQYLQGKKINADYIYAPKNGADLYTSKDLDLIGKAVKTNKIVGLSSFSICEDRTFQLANYIKTEYPEKLVILGGPNVIMDPERILKESKADSVCIHEGEIPLENLIKNYPKEYTNIKGLWFKKGKKIIKNDFQKPLETLDEISFENYKNSKFGKYQRLTSNGFVSEKTLGEKIKNPCMQGNFLYIMTIRGCVYSCSYCINSRLNEINRITGTKILRKKSTDSIVKELKKTIKGEKNIEKIFFFDDDFFIRTEKELEEFAKKYKKEIGLPFMVFANPLSMTPKKIDLGVKAGLDSVEFGLQTVAEHTLKEYNRPSDAKKVREILEYVYNKKYNLNISIDFITNSPFENADDLKKNINYITNLPGNFLLYVHNLHLFPGIKLRAKYLTGTGFENTEYQNYGDALKNKMFNEYETKMLLAMQGWHRKSNPNKFGELTKQEITHLFNDKKMHKAENIKKLNKKIAETIVAKYYSGL